MLPCAVLLQFGHGGEAVETWTWSSAQTALADFNSATAVKPWRPSGPCGRRFAGVDFNSATAVKPWRRPLQLPPPPPVSVLQFGHGGEAVETRRSICPNRRPPVVTSIRPRR